MFSFVTATFSFFGTEKKEKKKYLAQIMVNKRQLCITMPAVNMMLSMTEMSSGRIHFMPRVLVHLLRYCVTVKIIRELLCRDVSKLCGSADVYLLADDVKAHK